MGLGHLGSYNGYADVLFEQFPYLVELSRKTAFKVFYVNFMQIIYHLVAISQHGFLGHAFS